MANPSKDAGTRQESNICKVLNAFAGREIARRVALNGNKDKGDLRIEIGAFVITGESKYSKRYPSEGNIEKFKEQTVKENIHAGQDGGVLFINVPGRSINRLECWLQRSTHCKLEMQRVGIVYPDDIPLESIERVEEFMRDSENGWRRVTLFDFMHEYLGHPAWEDRRD